MNRSSSAAASDPQLSAQAEAEAAGLKALASSSLTGSLTGTQIAFVVLPGASDDDVAAVRSTLTDAGASVVGRVTLTDNWQSTSMSQYRATLSTSLASHLESAAAKTASADGVVGYSIVQVLTSSGSETDLLRQILTDKSTPLMTIDEDPVGKATTLVAVGARAQAATSTQAAVAASSDAWIGLGMAVVPLPAWSSATRHRATHDLPDSHVGNRGDDRRLGGHDPRLRRHRARPIHRLERPPAPMEWVTEHSPSSRASSNARDDAICLVAPADLHR